MHSTATSDYAISIKRLNPALTAVVVAQIQSDLDNDHRPSRLS
jgi:hypothetical protein